MLVIPSVCKNLKKVHVHTVIDLKWTSKRRETVSKVKQFQTNKLHRDALLS